MPDVQGMCGADKSEPMSDRAVADVPHGPLSRCVGRVPAFFEEVWARQPRHYRDADSDRFADVFSLDVIDALLAPGGLRAPALRLVCGGKTIPRSSYTT